MITEIYYFSGTGNSLAVAKGVAEKTEATLIPIATLMNEEVIRTNADVVGIVFPVYYAELPMIVERFCMKLSGMEGIHIFAICTYGGAAGSSLRSLKRLIRSRGGKLRAGDGVHMPQNSFYKPRENCQELYGRWNKKLERIVNNITRKSKGMHYANAFLEWLLVPVFACLVKPVCKRHFVKSSGLPANRPYEEHKHVMDKHFTTNDQCNGCGICAKVCPVGNIEIKDKKPVWLNRCEHCLACYNWCPHKAIQGGIVAKEYHYRHPDVSFLEMMKQSGNG